MMVATKPGYERAYFDNYRKQIIFQKEKELAYLMDGIPVRTGTDTFTGYVSDVLINETYQLGIESLNPSTESLRTAHGWATKTRVIDLNTEKHVIIDGLLFHDNLLTDHYFYGVSFSPSDRGLDEDSVLGNDPMAYYLNIIDLRTMQHQKINISARDIRFLYQSGDKLYGQSEAKKTTFLFEGTTMIEQKSKYNELLTVSSGVGRMLKNVAPSNAREHWYISSEEGAHKLKQARLTQVGLDSTRIVSLDFGRDDIVQIMDVANYGEDKVALVLRTKDDNDELHAILTVFDIRGKEIRSEDISDVVGTDVMESIYLNYAA